MINKAQNAWLTSELLIKEPDLIDLIDKFMSRLPEMRRKINQAFSDKNWEEFSGLIHQMKGVGGGYGYPMLTAHCRKFESQITDENLDGMMTLIEEFNLMTDKILAGSDENHKIAEKDAP